MIHYGIYLSMVVAIAGVGAAATDDFRTLCADRAAVERVYYEHRLSTKPPFERTMPEALVRKLVHSDLRKESVLAQVYGVKVSEEMVQAEVRRIDATSRAPEILAGLKAALGNDSNRFARTVARPLVVERTLRARFENDDALHAPQRLEAEDVRTQILKSETSAEALARLKVALPGEYRETTWNLGPRPAGEAPRPLIAPCVPTTNTARGGAYEIESKAQITQAVPCMVPPDGDRAFYFEDLPADLQSVLRAQLHKAGDVSAVIETPRMFLVYVAREITTEKWRVASRAFPKRDYDAWLAEQK